MTDTREHLRFYWKLAARNDLGRLVNHDGGPYRDKSNCRATAEKVWIELIRHYGRQNVSRVEIQGIRTNDPACIEDIKGL